MADNITIKDGNNADTIVGSDNVGGVNFIRHKLVWGVDGVANDASASNPLPVTAATLPLPSGAATDATLATLSGKITVCNTGAVVISSQALPTGASTDATLATLSGKITACNTGAVTISGALPAGSSEIGGVNVTKLAGTVVDTNSGTKSAGTMRVVLATDQPSLTNPIPTVGNVAAGATDSTNPVKVGGVYNFVLPTLDDGDRGNVQLNINGAVLVDLETRLDEVNDAITAHLACAATTSLSGVTLVTDGGLANLRSGVDGVQITRPHCNLEDIVSGVTSITDGSSTSVIAAQGAGIVTYITDVIISNSSGTAVSVDIRDGASGSVKATFYAPATNGVTKTFTVPMPFSSNTAVCADPSNSASTIAVTLLGFTSKI